MNKIIIALLLLIFSNAHSSALMGIRETDILVEELREDELKCGLTKDIIDASIRLPISNTRIKFNSKADSFLYANVNAIYQGNYCVFNMRLEFRKYVNSERDVGAFWRKGQVAVWERNNVSRRIADEFESYTKQFIAAWLKEN